MKNKFQDFPPFDFEDFIAQLFKDNGYDVEKTPSSGDYGADILMAKSGEKIAVQVKRYAPDNKVGVQEINQVVGAKDFYKCDKAMIISTSSFSKRGKALAGETSTELWEWDKLQKYICDTYLDGKDYYAYFGDSPDKKGTEKTLQFEVTDVGFESTFHQKPGIFTVFVVNVTNQTDRNIDVILGLPTLITTSKHQVDAIIYDNQHFIKGVIYAGSSVFALFGFQGDLVPTVNEGDRLIFKWGEDEERFHTLDYKIPKSFAPTPSTPPKGSSCYIVTMCFGADSPEYREMIIFRDNILRRYRIGGWMISFYYEVGGYLAAWLRQIGIAKRLSRWMLKIPLMLIKQLNQHYDKRLG